MRSNDHVIKLIDESIAKLAADAGDKDAFAAVASEMALAALRLAEARAWLITPGQPHGNSGATSAPKSS